MSFTVRYSKSTRVEECLYRKWCSSYLDAVTRFLDGVSVPPAPSLLWDAGDKVRKEPAIVRCERYKKLYK